MTHSPEAIEAAARAIDLDLVASTAREYLAALAAFNGVKEPEEDASPEAWERWEAIDSRWDAAFGAWRAVLSSFETDDSDDTTAIIAVAFSDRCAALLAAAEVEGGCGQDSVPKSRPVNGSTPAPSEVDRERERRDLGRVLGVPVGTCEHEHASCQVGGTHVQTSECVGWAAEVGEPATSTRDGELAGLREAVAGWYAADTEWGKGGDVAPAFALDEVRHAYEALLAADRVREGEG